MTVRCHNFKKTVEENKTFLVTTHLNPDGDAIGSLLGFGLAIKTLNKELCLAIADFFPKSYKTLPGSEFIQHASSIKFDEASFDVGVVLDCADLGRAGKDLETILTNNCSYLINIDHHISNKSFGSLNIIDIAASATGEIVFEILENTGIKITPEVATNLYTAIVSDTGSFQYQNTTPKSHRIAASLIEYGADQRLVQQILHESHSLANIRLLEKSLSTLSVHTSGLIAWMTVTQNFLLETGSKLEDCEGFINYPKSLFGVELAILFKEVNKNEVKVSFRSKNNVDVNKLAAYFGGGGHERASGCTIQGPLEKVQEMVIQKAVNLFARDYGRIRNHAWFD